MLIFSERRDSSRLVDQGLQGRHAIRVPQSIQADRSNSSGANEITSLAVANKLELTSFGGQLFFFSPGEHGQSEFLKQSEI